jgi:hypothetical protein
MNKLIQVTPRKNFDRLDYYPANELAEQFCSLLNKPNLPKDSIIKLRAMGYEVQEKHEATI